MHRNETTPGRGYPLPASTNKLNVDVERIRAAIRAVDEDYLKLVRQMRDFLVRADEYLATIEDGFKNIDARQTRFDAEKAAEIRAMRDEVVARLAKFGEDADTCFGELGQRVNGAIASFRSDVDGEISRMTSRIPHYDELAGTIGSADSALPEGNTAPLQYVQGLGFFRFDPNADDPVDGETCIMPSDGNGRWLLALPDIDTLLSMLSDERAIRRLERAPVLHMLSTTSNLTWGSIAAQGGELVRNIPLPGAKAGDPVLVVPPAALAEGLGYCGSVSADGTVSVRCINSKASAVTPAAADWKVYIVKEGGLLHD